MGGGCAARAAAGGAARGGATAAGADDGGGVGGGGMKRFVSWRLREVPAAKACRMAAQGRSVVAGWPLIETT